MKKLVLWLLCLAVVLPLGTNTARAAEEEEITFSGLTAVDNEECSIYIQQIDPDGMWGYTLKAVLENKSADKTYMFTVDSGYINGVACDPVFATEVAPGKKANKEISFSTSDLEENGIDVFSDIELRLRVYDSDDWMADDVAEETVHIYPYGEEKAKLFVREEKDTDIVLADNDEATVIVTGYDPDGMWGYTVKLFLVNKTQTEAMFTVDDSSVNGFMLDPFFATTVGAGKCAFKEMSWFDSALEENGIEQVEQIEFSLRVYNDEDWESDDYINEQYALTP